MKNVLKGKYFAGVEEAKQQTAQALKGIQIGEFKNCFEQREKSLERCALNQMESTLKGTEM